MGDRAHMQIVQRNGTGLVTDFGPAVYAHWSGEAVPEIVARLAKRMENRRGDVEYASARLVQEAIYNDDDATGFGITNIDHVLNESDSHGDAGCILIDCETFKVEALGGYLKTKDGVFIKEGDDS